MLLRSLGSGVKDRISKAFELRPLSDLKQRKVSEAACPAAGTREQEHTQNQVWKSPFRRSIVKLSLGLYDSVLPKVPVSWDALGVGFGSVGISIRSLVRMQGSRRSKLKGVPFIYKRGPSNPDAFVELRHLTITPPCRQQKEDVSG